MKRAKAMTAVAVAAAAALGASALASGGETRSAATSGPYEQVIGTATITGINSGSPVDIRGMTYQRDPSPRILTLVRTADSNTVKLMADITGAQSLKVTVRLTAAPGSSFSLLTVHVVSDSVGTLGAVDGKPLEQIVFK